jgi:RNA polymerase sigma factor (sigma-70 family)
VEISEAEVESLRRKLRFKVCHRVGFACPDVDDIVQEAIVRFLKAAKEEKIHNIEATGAFLNGISQNVILEYRRKWNRDVVANEDPPEAVDRRSAHSELFEIHDAIVAGMQQLSARDREILKKFYFEERPKSEIVAKMGLTDETFRVVLCRAKERFRKLYNSGVKHRAV